MNIREVYREADALRIEFSSKENPRAVLSFWARDRNAAAHIVQLLPTSRTVEIEDSADIPRARSSPANRWSALAVTVVGIGTITLFLSTRSPAPVVATQPPPAARVEIPAPSAGSPAAPATDGTGPAAAPDSTSSASMPELLDTLGASIGDSAQSSSVMTAPSAQVADAPASAPVKSANPLPAPRDSQPTTSADDDAGFVPDPVPPIYMQTGDVVVPIRQNTLAYDKARSILSRFESGAAELSSAFRETRAQADSGRLDLNQFADQLESFASRWRDLGDRLLNTRDAGDPALTGFRASLLAVTTYQDSFLRGYAVAVRSRDVDSAVRAFEDLKHADEMLERARAYLR